MNIYALSFVIQLVTVTLLFLSGAIPLDFTAHQNNSYDAATASHIQAQFIDIGGTQG